MKHRLPSFAVLAAALAILSFLIFGLSVLLDKQRLWPAADQRHDITELLFATGEAACPAAFSSKNVGDFENCIAKDPRLLKEKFSTLKIPGLEDVSAGVVPRFVDLLKEQGYENFAEHLKAKKPYILGARVPGHLFSPKALGHEPNVLVFHKITDAFFCIDGSCSQHSNKNRYLAQTVALQSAAPVPPQEDQIVWIFGHDPLGAVGLYLGNGLFVAKDSDLGLARRFMPIAAHGLPIIFTLIFAAMLIVGLGFAAVWSDRFEFAAFVNFAGALALMTFPTDYILGDFYLKLPLGVVDTFTFWKTIYLPVSALVLALGVAGLRLSYILGFYAVANVVAISVFAAIIPDAGYAFVSKAWIRSTIGANVVTMAGPMLVILVRLKKEKLFSVKLLRDPRGLYLSLALVFFAVCGSQLVSAAWSLSRGQLTGSATPAPWAAMGLLALLTVLVYRSVQVIRGRLEKSQRDLVVATRQAAVAGAVQMLAHDARKPFTTLKMGLITLKKAASPAELQLRISMLTFETERNLAKINGMIADVLEAGAKSELKTTAAIPESLIESAIVDIVRIKNCPGLSFEYDLNHACAVSVDAQKVMRVFGNILDNAISAMKGRGRIWFRTRVIDHRQESFVEFVIGNSGSGIPEDSLARVFETFYTKDKAGGTGLGLAICKKIVEGHRGEITCRSDGKDFVEFIFTLPAAPLPDAKQVRYPLPSSSQDVLERLRSLSNVTISAAGEDDETESLLLSEVRLALANLGRPLQVLIVEDEVVYLESLIARLRELVSDESQMTILTASCGRQASAIARAEAPDLLICDIDLGSEGPDGYEVTRRILAVSRKTYVCHHTNRLGEASLRTSQASGADVVCPKPLGVRQMLDVLQNVMSRVCKADVQASVLDLKINIRDLVPPVTLPAEEIPQ